VFLCLILSSLTVYHISEEEDEVHHKKHLDNLPLKLCFLIHLDTHDHTVKIWSSFLNLYRLVTLEIHEFSNIEDIFEKCKGWVNDFIALGSLERKGFLFAFE
jgi:hypothetical protein